MNKKLELEEQEYLILVVKQIEKLINEFNGERHEYADYIQNSVKENKKRKVLEYINSLKSPYFGRLNLQFEGYEYSESFLLGEKSIAKSETEEIVVDWRSSIGDIFYKFYGGSGHLQFKNEMGEKINVLVDKKRNINIQDSNVISVKETVSEEYLLTSKDNVDVYDTPITDFLSQFGSDFSENYQVKKIIKTIQKEQNEVIRLGIDQPVLIQGVAGSGKTTIALHRLSYLIYQFRNKLKLENMLILAPNKLFISYIKDILPDLEINKIQQSTFVELAKNILPFINTIELPQLYLSNIISESTIEVGKSIQKFKGSIEFKNLINQYLEYLEKDFLVSKQVKLPTFTRNDYINANEEFKKIYQGYKHMPLNKRRKETIKSIRNWKETEINKQINILRDEAIKSLNRWKNPIPDTNSLSKEVEQTIMKSFEFQIEDLNKKWNQKVNEYISEWKELDVLEVYNNLMEVPLLISLSEINEKLATECVEEFYSYDKKLMVRYDDLAPLMYIQEKINGINIKYDYMMIDEAQDLSPYQISLLNSYANSMTILGDITQSIYGDLGTQNWNDITIQVFKSNYKRLDLSISYRSSYEIMDAANKVLKKSGYSFPSIEPISRHGKEVEYKKVNDGNDLIDKIDKKLTDLLNNGYSKIAVISKSMKLSKKIFEQFVEKGYSEIQLVDNLDDELKEKIIFISSELVKGLEFDAVIIPNANHRAYSVSMLDTKLLFVSMTRAQEELHIYYYEEASPLLTHLVSESNSDVDVLSGLL